MLYGAPRGAAAGMIRSIREEKMRAWLSIVLVMTLTTVLYPPLADAKRAAAAVITPIVQGDHRYYYERADAPDGGSYSMNLVCSEGKTGQLLWKTRIYDKAVDRGLERDIQDIWLKSLSLNGNLLIAEDEKGGTYQVDLATGALLSPEEVIHY